MAEAAILEDRGSSIGRALGTIRFSVLRWSAWSPGRPTRAAWREWAGAAAYPADERTSQPLPVMLRRRLTPFGQKLIQVAQDCTEGLPPSRHVLSTRHGEFRRALSCLAAIETDGLPSPTDFSLSIHHALLGLLSIEGGNRLGHTALSGGWDSFASGLLEAAACLAERPDEPVLLIYADEPLPDAYAAFAEGHDAALPLLVAFALGAPGLNPESDLEFSITSSPHSGAAPTACMAIDFLRFVLSGAATADSAGRRLRWIGRRAR